MDRWNIVSALNYLAHEAECEIIRKVDALAKNAKVKRLIANMVSVADLTRKGFVNGDVSTVMSPELCLRGLRTQRFLTMLVSLFGSLSE